MNSIEELKEAIASNKKMVWNDPEPIEGNDYVITFVEPLDEDFDEDTPILIQYGEGSEAEVFLHEISLFDEGQTYTVTLTLNQLKIIYNGMEWIDINLEQPKAGKYVVKTVSPKGIKRKIEAVYQVIDDKGKFNVSNQTVTHWLKEN